MPVNGYLTTLPSDVLINPAMVAIGFTAIGVTKGGVKFDPGMAYENVGFDGKHADIYLLDRKIQGTPKATFTMIELGPAATGGQIAKIEPGSAAVATVTTTGSELTIVTPLTAGAFLASGSYQSNFRLIWDRGVGSGVSRYLCLLFAKALFAKYNISGAGTDVATIDVEVEARKDMSSGAVTDVPYVIELRAALA